MKFDGRDFPVWKAQVGALIISKGWDAALTSELKDVAAGQKDEFIKADKMAKSLLLMSLDNKHAKLVLTCTTAKQIWDKLSANQEHKSSASRMLLQKQFFDLSMAPGESVRDYVARGEYLRGQLEDVGINSITEETLVARLLGNMSGMTHSIVHFLNFVHFLDFVNFYSNFIIRISDENKSMCVIRQLLRHIYSDRYDCISRW